MSLVYYSNLKKNRLYRSRTVSFEKTPETPIKIRGNMVFVMTDDSTVLNNIVNSELFKKTYIRGIYAPRVIRPLNRKILRTPQKDIYTDIKNSSHLSISRVTLEQYKGHNVYYDILPEYQASISLCLRQSMAKAKQLSETLIQILDKGIEEASTAYKKYILVFPVVKEYPSIKSNLMTDYDNTDPLILMFMAFIKGWIPYEYLKKFDVVFYAPNCDVLMALDTESPFDEVRAKLIPFLNRMCRFVSGAEDPAVLDAENATSMTQEEKDAERISTKLNIAKDRVVHHYLAKLKIDAVDVRDMTDEEKDIVLDIETKVDTLIDANAAFNMNDVQYAIDTDTQLKRKMLAYSDIKRSTASNTANIEKHLDDEYNVLSRDIDNDSIESDDVVIVPDKYNVDGLDPRMAQNNFNAIDKEYSKKLLVKDRDSVFTSMSLANESAVVLDDMTVEDTSDDYTKKETVTCKYSDNHGKPMTVTVDVPKLINDKYIYSGGTKMLINRQLVRLPIVKTKNNCVEITTNYNKMMIERTNGKIYRDNSYLYKILTTEKFPDVTIEFGNSKINDKYTSDFQYEELGTDVKTITSPDYNLMFNRDAMVTVLNEERPIGISEYANSSEFTPFGIDSFENTIVINNATRKVELINNSKKRTIVSDSLFNFIVDIVLKRSQKKELPVIGKSFIYTKTHFLGQGFPTFIVLAMTYEMDTVLRAYNVKYTFTKDKLPDEVGFVSVKFKDGYFRFNTTIENTLLLNILTSMQTENYDFKDFNTKRPYMEWLMDKMGSSEQTYSMIKYNLEAMIDPITYKVLLDLKLPTTILELLLYANTLLANNEHRPLNDFRNFRLRRGEIVNALLSKQMSDAFVTYQRKVANGSSKAKLEIDKSAVMKALVSAPNVTPHSILNPSLEIESLATVSHKGPSGINLSAAYTLAVRAYDTDSMVGVCGNGTPFGGGAGINRFMAVNPKISHVRGYIGDINKTELNASNIYSPTELLNAYNTHSDPVRSAMTVGQSKHVIAVRDSDPPLIGSGYNRVIPYMISDDFVFKAKANGIVDNIDKQNELATLLYDTGAKDVIDLSGVTAKNSSMGFYQFNKLEMRYGVGERFLEGDIIASNGSFFKGRGSNVSLMLGSLCKIALSPNDSCYQDAAQICETVSNKCASKVTMQKAVSLGSNAIIHQMVNVGDEIKTGEPLMKFTRSYDDPNTLEFMKELMKDSTEDDISVESIDSKISGKIVDIKIYYNEDLDKLSPSLQTLINNYKARQDIRRNAVAAVNADSVIIPAVEKSNIAKLNGKQFDGVLVEFYTEFVDKMSFGDKGTASIALKFTVSKILPLEEAPFSEYDKDEPVELIVSPTSLISRMVPDLVLQIGTNKVLIDLKRKIGDIYNIKVPKPYECGVN